MSNFLEVVTGKKFQCDNCKKIFNGEKIKLSQAPRNIHFENLMVSFKFIDKDGKIMGGHKGPDGNIGDQVAMCPFCDEIHFFGFDSVP